MRRVVVALFALSLLAAAGCSPNLAGEPGDSTASTATTVKQRDAAENLVFIDGYSSKSVEARRIRVLLDELDAAFPEQTRRDIADMTAGGVSQLEKKGIEEKCLAIMEGIHSVFPEQATIDYSGMVAAYVLKRHRGETHENAVKGLRVMVGSMKEPLGKTASAQQRVARRYPESKRQQIYKEKIDAQRKAAAMIEEALRSGRSPRSLSDSNFPDKARRTYDTPLAKKYKLTQEELDAIWHEGLRKRWTAAPR